MRLDNEKPDYDSIEDRRGQGGGMGFPGGGRGGRGVNIPIGMGRGGFSFKTIIFLVIVYFFVKFVFGLDLLQVLNGGGMSVPGSGQDTQITLPDTRTEVTDASGGGLENPNVPSANSDAGKEFVARVLGSNNRVWGEILGSNYQKPKLVLFSGFVQSACGNAQAAMGPFYCPADQKVYIDLSFYQDMKNKLGAPGDFAQAYVIAHEVGHHVQNLLGIADKVTQARMRASKADANALSVRMELQADCFSGIWAQEANASAKILEDGDIEEGLNAQSLKDCDTFSASSL